MRQSKLADLYDRLTSRKFWLAGISIAFGLWNYLEGRLSAVEFQAVVFAAVGVYTVSEAATDVATNWHSAPDTTVKTTVNTGEAAPAASVTAPPKRPRKSRAKRASP